MIERTFFTAADDFAEHPLAVVCRLLSGVLCVLLSEQGGAAELKLGVVRRMKEGRDFTHSWLDVQSAPLGAYMDECPFYPEGGWEIVSRIAARFGLKADTRTLRAKYLTTMRAVVAAGEQAPIPM